MSRSTAAIFFVLASGSLALGEHDPAPTVNQDKGKNESASKPGWVSIREEIWLRLADEPSRLMTQADESFLRKDYDSASSELHRSAAYLHGAYSHAAAGPKSALEASAEEIDRLAAGVKSGAVESSKELENAFARAEYALAWHRHQKAKAAFDQKQYKLAGSYLRTTVAHLENASEFIGFLAEYE